MKSSRIFFNKPVVLEGHLEYLNELLDPQYQSRHHSFIYKTEALLENLLGCKVLLTSSATHSLEMMALLLNITQRDEVIVPSFAFVSTASAFVLRGARLIYADNELSGNISVRKIRHLITERTRAVVAVDYAGTSEDLYELRSFCDFRKILLLEDSAAGLGAAWMGKPLGTFGSMGCFSFHDTKVTTAGEGGALIFGEQLFFERAQILREKGTNRKQFMEGKVDFYSWVDLGSSFSMSNVSAAYLYPQILNLPHILQRRKKYWEFYVQELTTDLIKKGIRLIEKSNQVQSNYHQFSLILRNQNEKRRFIEHMHLNDIEVATHYAPLHLSVYGRRWWEGEASLPGAELLGHLMVRLPLYYNLSEIELDKIVASVRSFR